MTHGYVSPANGWFNAIPMLLFEQLPIDQPVQSIASSKQEVPQDAESALDPLRAPISSNRRKNGTPKKEQRHPQSSPSLEGYRAVPFVSRFR
jgi:hypothetical protein